MDLALTKIVTGLNAFVNLLGDLAGSGYRANKPTPIHSASDDVLRIIFSYLSVIDFIRVGGVCHRWRVLTHDSLLWKKEWRLNSFFPQLTVIDEIVWQQNADLGALGLSFADFSSSNRSRVSAIISMAQLPLEGEAGMTLLTVPKGLNFSKLQSLADAKLGPKAFFIWRKDQLDDSSIERTHQVVIGNSILKGSRKQPRLVQEELLAKIDCEIPETLSVLTQIVLTLISHPESQLYSDPNRHQYKRRMVNDKTLTSCAEEVSFLNQRAKDKNRLIYRAVGRHATADGYRYSVTSNYSLDYGHGHEAIGVGAMKRIAAKRS